MLPFLFCCHFFLPLSGIRNRYRQTIYYLSNCTRYISIQNKACIITDNYIFFLKLLEELFTIFIVDFRKLILCGAKSVNEALNDKHKILFTIVVHILNILKSSKCLGYSYSIFRMGTTIFKVCRNIILKNPFSGACPIES
jgi:hypothetical protein